MSPGVPLALGCVAGDTALVSIQPQADVVGPKARSVLAVGAHAPASRPCGSTRSGIAPPTLLPGDGTPLSDESEILGHSAIGVTANVYGHLVGDTTAGAAARMDALLAPKGTKR